MAIENSNRDREIENAAFEILTERHGAAPIGTGPDRVWRDDLDPDERKDRRRLEEARFNGGLTADDRARYHQLTVHAPVKAVDWKNLDPGLRDEAERRVNERRRRTRGEGRDRRIHGTRNRFPSWLRLSPQPFGHQIGVINTSDDAFVLERAVRNLRRNAKRLGLHAPHYDRRRKSASVEPSTDPLRITH
jgi:hypothetical protein